MADNMDPDGIHIWTGLTDRVFQTRHMDRFLVFPMPAVAFNLQDPGFIPDDLLNLLMGILG
jgi:hypothetical protein